MDISYACEEGKFNCRVCGVMIDNDRILAMHDEVSPYYYLPGGRVKMMETAEHAAIREVEEELNVIPKIVRPLWLSQSFFNEDVEKIDFHELCIYFLLDISDTDLFERGDRFTLNERHHTHEFEWIPFGRLKDEYFYPEFLKTEIFHLPDCFTIRTDYE